MINCLQALTIYCSNHGTPLSIVTDNEFNNRIFKAFCLLHAVHLHTTTPKSSTENSAVDRLYSIP